MSPTEKQSHPTIEVVESKEVPGVTFTHRVISHGLRTKLASALRSTLRKSSVANISDLQHAAGCGTQEPSGDVKSILREFYNLLTETLGKHTGNDAINMAVTEALAGILKQIPEPGAPPPWKCAPGCPRMTTDAQLGLLECQAIEDRARMEHLLCGVTGLSVKVGEALVTYDGIFEALASGAPTGNFPLPPNTPTWYDHFLDYAPESLVSEIFSTLRAAVIGMTRQQAKNSGSPSTTTPGTTEADTSATSASAPVPGESETVESIIEATPV